MKIYATSDLPCFFKINGEYAGVIDKNLSLYDCAIEDSLFEALPKNTNYLPCYSGITGSENLKVFKVEGGVLIYPVLKKGVDVSFKMVGQTSAIVNGIDTLLTVVVDGTARFYLDGIIKDVKPLPFTPEKFEIYAENNLLFVSFFREKTALFIYDLTTNKVVFNSVVTAFSFGDTLTVKKEYQTAIKTTVIEKWNLTQTPTLTSVSDEKEKSFFDLSPKLIPLAFFESVVIGASVLEVVTPSLHKRCGDLKEFLGKVIRVIPSPTCDSEVWLVMQNCVTRGRLAFENGLISNVLLDDF